MDLTFGQSYNSKCAFALEQSERVFDVVYIEAHGLEYTYMSRDSFLREYYRDILEEEWCMLCKFLKIALSKDNNHPVAVQTLIKGIAMKLSELKDKSMAELVEMYNKLAEAAEKKPVTKFKTLEAGRLEIVKLANAKPPKTAADKPAGEEGTGRKRQGIGVFAKDLLRKGVSVADTFTQTLAQFPTAQTTKACISYYKNALVKAGELPGGRAKSATPPVASSPAPVAAKGVKKGKAATATA